MDTGKPSQDDANLVQRNQQIANDTNSNDSSNLTSNNNGTSIPPTTPPTPSTDPAPTPLPTPTPEPPKPEIPPTPEPTAPPMPTPTPPTPPAPKPPESPIPFQDDIKDNDNNLGVGTPNIGIEDAPKPSYPPSDPMGAPTLEQPKTDTATAEPEHHDEVKPQLNAIDPTPTSSARDSEDTPQISIQEAPKMDTPNQAEPATIDADDSADSFQVKNYQTNPTQPIQDNQPQPPVKASNNAGLMAFIVVALILGSAGGFFGFKYWDNLKSQASTVSTSAPDAQESTTPSLDTSTWKVYSSTAYNFSLKYPTTWFASSTASDAESLIFASNQESLETTPTGLKIDITFQPNNGKTLKSWAEANAVTVGETSKLNEITVSGQTAYQQELKKNGPKVATYIERADKIMIVTYSAPTEDFGTGGEWYNNLINSIKLI